MERCLSPHRSTNILWKAALKAFNSVSPPARTVFRLEEELKKTAVLVHDGTAFVVNRLLLRMAGTILNAFDDCTPADTADNAWKPMGLPETPFALLVRLARRWRNISANPCMHHASCLMRREASHLEQPAENDRAQH